MMKLNGFFFIFRIDILIEIDNKLTLEIFLRIINKIMTARFFKAGIYRSLLRPIMVCDS